MGRNSGGGGRTNGGRGRGPVAAGSVTGAIAAAPATVAEAVSPGPAQTAGLLERSVVTTRFNGNINTTWTNYTFNTSTGQEVILTVSQRGNAGSIEFAIDRNLDMAGLPREMANAISMRLMRHIREDARTRPDGFSYHAQAWTGDGLVEGTQRAVAYQAIGMSRPQGALVGEQQYATVRNGRLAPNNEYLRMREGRAYELNNERWQEQVGNFRSARNARR